MLPASGDKAPLINSSSEKIEKAFIDMLWNSSDPGHTKMMERVDRQEGRHITEYAEEIGLGSTQYELIEI